MPFVQIADRDKVVMVVRETCEHDEHRNGRSGVVRRTSNQNHEQTGGRHASFGLLAMATWAKGRPHFHSKRDQAPCTYRDENHGDGETNAGVAGYPAKSQKEHDAETVMQRRQQNTATQRGRQ